MNNLPYLPTELWDKIFNIKYSIETKEHNNYYKPLLEEIHERIDSFNCFGYVDFDEWYFECLECGDYDINNMEYDPLT